MSRPRLRLGGHLVPGLAAVALFAVMAFVFLGASFGSAAGFPADAHITAAIGYAMFDITTGADVPSEGFLVAFIVIAVVLDAALDGAVMLAKRESGEFFTRVRTDGGRSDERGDEK